MRWLIVMMLKPSQIGARPGWDWQAGQACLVPRADLH